MRTHHKLSGGGGKRSGLVRASGRSVVDDGGEFFPLGLTFMWSLQGSRNEPERYRQNLEWAASKGFDFKRPLYEVDWADPLCIDPTRPEWADWKEVIARDLDASYALGLRSGITLRGKGTAVDPLWLAREAAKVIADGRIPSVLCIEMMNEYWNGGRPLSELQAMAQEVARHIPNMLALSAPNADSEADADAVKAASLSSGVVTVMNRHTERSTADYGWRDVRQSYDCYKDRPLVGADWEGPGPGSSGSVNASPLQLAMKRAVAAMCGAPIFVLHTGTGVFGDGKPGGTGPRPPNFWEIDNIDAIVSAVRGIDALLPLGVSNWMVANTQWTPPLPVAPFQPHNHWEGDVGDGVNKAYSALAPDGRVIQMPCGVRGHVKLTASYRLTGVTVFDPLTLAPLPNFTDRSYSQGEVMELPGGGLKANVAYVIKGQR